MKTPLPEQEGPTEGLDIDIEVLSTKELAYHITLFDWDLFWAVHEYELLYHTFGRHHFGKVTAMKSQLSLKAIKLSYIRTAFSMILNRNELG